MTILPQSRYIQNSVTTRVADSEGTYNLTVFRTTPQTSGVFRLYIWQIGDRPDSVAEKFLGDPGLWWAIFDVNPELIYPLSVPPSTVVRIPTGPVLGQGTLNQ